MSIEIQSTRSINFKTIDDPKTSADNLAIAVSIILYRLNEYAIKQQLEKFQDGVNRIQELSTVKNRFTAEFNALSEEEKKEGAFYVNAEGHIVPLTEYDNSTPPLDPAELIDKPITSTWTSKVETNSGADTASRSVLDVAIEYELGFDEEEQQYYVHIASIQIGEYTVVSADIDETAANTTSKTEKEYVRDTSDDESERIYLDGTKSLTEIISDELDDFIVSLEDENLLAPSDPNNRSNLYSALKEQQDIITNRLTGDIFDTAINQGFDEKAVDAIFTHAGGASSIEQVKLHDGNWALNFELGGYDFRLDTFWEFDAESQTYTFDAYISIPDLTAANEITNNSYWSYHNNYNGNEKELLNIAHVEAKKPKSGQSEQEYLNEIFKQIIDKAAETLYENAKDAVDNASAKTAFWLRLFGEDLNATVEDQRKGADEITINAKHIQEDFRVFLDAIGGRGIAKKAPAWQWLRKHHTQNGYYYKGLDDKDFQLISQAITSKLLETGNTTFTDGNESFNELLTTFDFSLAEGADSAVATDGTTALIAGFYEPNPEGSIAALLEEVLGEDIYKNGHAYTATYWNDHVLAQVEDVISTMSSQNEITMAKLRRLIETANTYLQMIITALQKQFQSLNAIGNNL